MTLVEANELFESWSYAPPVNMLVEALLRGLGGGPVYKPEAGAASVQASGAIDNVTDAQLAALSVKAGHALPIRKGKDIGLPNKAPVFDFEELRQRNKQTIIDGALRNKNRGQRA